MSYSSEVLADSPLIYLRLGDSSGTTAVDSSGNGRNGTYAGGTLPTLGTTGLLTGDSDTAVTMTGAASQKVTVADDNSLDGLSALTIEVWFKGSAALSGTNYLANRDDGSSNRSFLFRISSSKLQFVKVPNGTVTATAATTLTTSTLYHLAAVYNGTDIRLYVNGTLDNTPAAATGTLGTITQVLEVACRLTGNSNPGVYDEFAVYGTALSATRIAAHYTAGTATGAFTGAVSVDPAVTITATGVVGTTTTADVTGAITIGGTGVTGTASTASVSETATITAAGATGKNSTAATAETVTITATGAAGPTGAASVAEATTVTASGSVGRSTTAAVSESATVTADGVVGMAGNAAVTETVNITAAGTVGAPGALTGTAALAPTVAITATGSTGSSASATVNAGVIIVATGVVGTSSAANVALSAAIVAAANSFDPASPTPDERRYIVLVEHRTAMVAAEDRTYTIRADPRALVIAAENRTRTIPAEPRTVEVT